jgi:hypothetical protein
MSAAPGTIPYEKQADPANSRMCGAACLSMVYRSLGLDIPQAEIWPAIAKVNRFGRLSSTTHLMAQDALGRGLSAVAFQARHPIQALRLCREYGVRAILNHRPEPLSPAGHYSVMVDLDSKNVYLHDPLFGPARSVSHTELLDLWQPKFSNSEIVGGVLIAIAKEPPDMPPCPFCHTPAPSSIECPNCRKLVGLQPSSVLGCMNQNCIARQWNYICCPACDLMWNSETHLKPAGAGVAAAATPGASEVPVFPAEPSNLPQLFEALDKFVEHVKSIPEAAANASIQQQLARLPDIRASLKQGYAEGAMHGKALTDQLAAFTMAAEVRAEAHRKRMEEVNKQAEPLDGVALGKALLKNLGFTNQAG